MYRNKYKMATPFERLQTWKAYLWSRYINSSGGVVVLFRCYYSVVGHLVVKTGHGTCDPSIVLLGRLLSSGNFVVKAGLVCFSIVLLGQSGDLCHPGDRGYIHSPVSLPWA